MKNRILAFTGNGKGKTTAAFGMAMRAAGHNKNVLIVQFVKSDDLVGEVQIIDKLPTITLIQAGVGFIHSGNVSKHVTAAQQGFALTKSLLSSKEFDMIILDEIFIALKYGFLDEDMVYDAIKEARDGIIIVMTGRYASEKMLSLADTITHMMCIAHAFDHEINAQIGVEM